MATGQPRRNRLPVHRFGIDDNNSDDEIEQLADDFENEEGAIIAEEDADTGSSSEEDDQDIEELANANAGWVFVLPEADVNFQELSFTGQSGWRADVSAESLNTVGEYCDQFLTPELYAKMAE